MVSDMATELISSGLIQLSQAVQPINKVHPSQPTSPLAEAMSSARPDERASKEAEKEPRNLSRLVEDLNETPQFQKRSIQFSLDDDSGKTIVRVVNSETDELIRQIPSEEVVKLMKRVQEYSGSLLQAEA